MEWIRNEDAKKMRFKIKKPLLKRVEQIFLKLLKHMKRMNEGRFDKYIQSECDEIKGRSRPKRRWIK